MKGIQFLIELSLRIKLKSAAILASTRNRMNQKLKILLLEDIDSVMD